jgi:hypothetical protein
MDTGIVIIFVIMAVLIGYVIGLLHNVQRPKPRVIFYEINLGDSVPDAIRKMAHLANRHNALVLARTNVYGDERLIYSFPLDVEWRALKRAGFPDDDDDETEAQ